LPSSKSKDAGLRTGKITSCVGNMAIASLKLTSDTSINLNKAHRLYKRKVSVNNKRIGRILDVIGRIERPYLVIRLNRSIEKSDSLVGKKISIN